ncbi:MULTISPECIES: transposase domain-containing protein [unclassified Novosphingobium]|uniref:transposase domain-containing protein n=1 Tax=unclassified Novosphingobium TaxID=2644732 RepID=UPI001494236E
MCELTARVDDANPLTWFTNVLARIADIRQTRLHELLPWHCRVAQQRHIQGNCCLNSAGSAPASRWTFIKSRPADSDDAGRLFRSDPGHDSDLMPASVSLIAGC